MNGEDETSGDEMNIFSRLKSDPLPPPQKYTAVVECRAVTRCRTQLGDPSKDIWQYKLYTFLRYHEIGLEQYVGAWGCEDNYAEPAGVTSRKEDFLSLGTQYAFSLFGPLKQPKDKPLPGVLVECDREPKPDSSHRWRFYSITMGTGLWWPSCHFAVANVTQGGGTTKVNFKKGYIYRVSLSAEIPVTQ